MGYDFKILNFDGWHGTSEENENRILAANFTPSEGSDHWLGEGVYFFTQGIGEPVEHAKNWVKFRTKYRDYSILKATTIVNDDAFLDLTKSEGLELFQERQGFIIGQLKRGKRGFKSSDYTDGKVFEYLMKHGGIGVVKSNMRVIFDNDRDGIKSRFPNCTFLCTYYPDENIPHSSIEIVEKSVL